MSERNKQKWTDAQWRKAYNESLSLVSVSRIDKLIHKAETRIINNYIEGKTLIGWSGGKDSVVLRHICDSCLKSPQYLICTVENEFIEFVEWKKIHAPKLLHTVHYGKMSVQYFNEHEDLLFPETDEQLQHFRADRTKETIHKYMRDRGYTKFITGKRYDDGNNCGSENENKCKSTIAKSGHSYVETLNVICDWTIYELFAYMRIFNLELPPQYYFPNGFKTGSNEWTKTRRVDHSYKKTFDFVAKYAKNNIVKAADDGLIMAQKYLKGELHD